MFRYSAILPLPISPSFTLKPCCDTTQAPKDFRSRGHVHNDSTSTSRPQWNFLHAVPASLDQASPKTQGPDHDQQRDGGSFSAPTPTLGSTNADNHDNADREFSAGCGGGGGESEGSVTRYRPGAWSSWAKDDPSENTGPETMNTTDRKGMSTCRVPTSSFTTDGGSDREIEGRAEYYGGGGGCSATHSIRLPETSPTAERCSFLTFSREGLS